MLDKGFHKREDVGVIGGCSKNNSAVAESVLNSLSHITAGKVVNNNLGAALGFEPFGKQLNCFFGVAVNGGIGNHYAVAFNAVGRPCVIKVEIVAEIFGKNGAVQGANLFDIKVCRFFEQSLNLSAVFADYADIISACFASPVLVCVK